MKFTILLLLAALSGGCVSVKRTVVYTDDPKKGVEAGAAQEKGPNAPSTPKK